MYTCCSTKNSDYANYLIYFAISSQELKINFHHPKLSGERTVQNAITEVAAMMGENVKLRRGFAMSAPSYGILSTYLHTSPQPGRVSFTFTTLVYWREKGNGCA